MTVTVLRGEVLTMGRPARAEAVAIDGARIAAVGEAESLLDRFSGAEVVRCERITPGLHDAHVHPLYMGQAVQELDLTGQTDPRQVAEQARKRAAGVPRGQWVVGRNYLFDHHPEPELLRAAVPDHPVFLGCRDLHSAWVNHLALDAAGLGPDCADPPDGALVRDEHGAPTGVLLEGAVGLVRRRLPGPGPDDLARGLAELARRGYTAAHAQGHTVAAALGWAEQLAASGELPVRLWWAHLADQLEGVQPGWRGERLEVAAVKLFADGALGSRTAWMSEPYADGSHGISMDRPEHIREVGQRALAAGWTLSVHAIGTRATSEVVRVLTELAPLARRPLRLEHAQHLTDETLAALRAPLAVSLQPGHLVGDDSLIERLLPGQQREAYRFADLLATGVPVAFGSDAPVVAPDVQVALRSAMAHPWRSDQSLTLQQALGAFTRGAAAAAGWSHCGVIAPGLVADLTLWRDGVVVGRVFDGALEWLADR